MSGSREGTGRNDCRVSPGEHTNVERNIATGNAIRWVEGYEKVRRNLNELYDWFGIRPDAPVA